MNALEFLPAEGIFVFDVVSVFGVMGQFVRSVLMKSAAAPVYAQPFLVPGHPLGLPHLERLVLGSGFTKYCISICSNSQVLKIKFFVVISFRNALPTWAIPKGICTRLVSTTFLKFTKMPWAVSGRQINQAALVGHGAHVGGEHQVELTGLGEFPAAFRDRFRR